MAQQDFIKHGSAGHAQLLGLRKATKEDEPQYEGWALQDPTQWGPNARPEYIRAQLIQRVGELTSVPEVPKNAPEMWTPPVGQIQ